MTIEVINVLEDQYWKKRVLDSIPDILQSGHHNAENYRDLEKRLELYDCFNLAVDTTSDELLAISGLFNGGIYPAHIARVVDRTYYYNWKKNTASPWNPATRYNGKYFIPYQIKLASKLGYDYVFISVQNIKKRKSLARMISCPEYENKFTLLDDLYNTCRIINNNVTDHQACWQNIAVFKINNNDSEFDLPSITIEEFNDRFKNIKSIR